MENVVDGPGAFSLARLSINFLNSAVDVTYPLSTLYSQTANYYNFLTILMLTTEITTSMKNDSRKGEGSGFLLLALEVFGVFLHNLRNIIAGRV
jgi:hypothetical protein